MLTVMENRRRQQEQWMRERAVAKDREAVESEMQRHSVSRASASSASSAGHGSSVRLNGNDRGNERGGDRGALSGGGMASMSGMGGLSGQGGADMLNRLADRISTRLREELKVEIERECKGEGGGGGGGRGGDSALAGHNSSSVQQFLSSELQSHSCPVCFELMCPPDRNPILLFPCGHTFCETCIKTHEKKNNKKCPYCRTLWTSQAINHSLKQLVESFLSKKTQPGRRSFSQCGSTVIGNGNGNGGGGGGGGGRSASGGWGHGGSGGSGDGGEGPSSARYEEQRRALEMRCQILEQERADTKVALEGMDRRLHSTDTVMRQLEVERRRAEDRVRQANEQLSLAVSHIEEQAGKRAEMGELKAEYTARVKMVDATLIGLRRDVDKAKVMIESLSSVGGGGGYR